MMFRRDTVLIVDDQEVNRVILRGAFEQEYQILEASDGGQAMSLVNQYHSRIAAVLLDIIMPVKDGYEVLREVGSYGYLSEFPVVIITAAGSADNEVRAFDLGASDIIAKPFELHVVKRRVQNIIELNEHKLHQEELIEEQAEKLRSTNTVMIDALSYMIEYRSIETGKHVQRIRMFTKVLLDDVARRYPDYMLDEHKINIIANASSMHDIGKIAIPDSILNKPGRLTQEEFAIMKTHSLRGSEMLSRLERISDHEYLQYAYNICRYHHERWNGCGYPDGLKGDTIPICAQVVGVSDCFDALTTDRVYKKAIPADEALRMILNGECGVFSPRLLDSFSMVGAKFAALAASHADNSEKAGNEELDTRTGSFLRNGYDDAKLGEQKYCALLKYMKSTVIEVDFASGHYHMMYVSDEDFSTFMTQRSFGDALANFIKYRVHPDDKMTVQGFVDDSVKALFEEGIMQCLRRCRVWDEHTNNYIWYLLTMLRIDLEHPRQRKALIVLEREKTKKNL